VAAADSYTADLIARLGDFFDRAPKWHRGLWNVGLVLSFRELYEAAEWVSGGVLSSRAVKWLAASTRESLASDPGAGEESQRKAIEALLTRPVVSGGVDHRALRIWIEDISQNYLSRWRGAVAEADRPPRELTARGLAAHLLDQGVSRERLRGWQRNISDSADVVDAPALFESAESLIKGGPQSFEVMVLFLRPPAVDTAKPAQWRDAHAVSVWLRSNGSPPVRQHGGLLLELEAQDAHGAAALAADVVERLLARANVGTRKKLEFADAVFVGGQKNPLPLRRPRRAEVHSLERQGELLTIDQGGPIDASLELLSHLNSAAPPVAVAGGWSAVESLLSAPGDEDRIITAERLGYLVACSWPRAELTGLAWARQNQAPSASDALAGRLAACSTNRQRAECVRRAIANGEDLKLTVLADQLAVRRMERLITSPSAKLAAVQRHSARAFRRLYRQRNLVLHGGHTAGVSLRAAVRTAAPLVGAGIDRITHASLAGDVRPLDLAARAHVEVERAGTSQAPALTALLE
jgi:hypothetical protein